MASIRNKTVACKPQQHYHENPVHNLRMLQINGLESADKGNGATTLLLGIPYAFASEFA